MLRMLLSLASYRGWPIETWDVSTAFLYASETVWGSRHGPGWSIHLHETTKGDREVRVTPGRDHLEAEEGALWATNIAVSLGSGT